MEAIIAQNVEKAALIPLTHVYQPTLENDGAWGVQNQLLPNATCVVKFPLTKYFVAHMNGHCKGTCVNTKLWSFSHAQTFFKRISFNIVKHGMDHIMKGSITCLQTQNIF